MIPTGTPVSSSSRAMYDRASAGRSPNDRKPCTGFDHPDSGRILLDGKEVQVGVIDVASDTIETPEQVADVIGEAMKYVARDKLIPSTNCGMAPMRREVAVGKLNALGAGAALARKRFA